MLNSREEKKNKRECRQRAACVQAQQEEGEGPSVIVQNEPQKEEQHLDALFA